MITAKDVAKAHKILNGVVVNTPLEFDHYLSEKYGAKIYLKKENAQRVRSFKIRGAYYAISQLKNVNVGWCVLQRGTTPKVWPIPVMK